MKTIPATNLPEDTIAAIATAQGEGGISIIRISGPRAFKIAACLFIPQNGRSIDAMPGYTMAYGEIIEPGTGRHIDEAIISVMRAPKSYTKEDVAELNCHGGPVAARLTLEAVIAAGARLAEPGEFTKRAYLNGRLDLAQAEAVIDIIRARTDRAARQALRQLEGRLSNDIEDLEGLLLAALVQVEAAVDFSDEDIYIEPRDTVMKAIDMAEKKIDSLLIGFREGEIIRSGVRLAIVGRPNVGKSSLLNALLKRDRAIVTSAPGTTRDTIEEALSISGIAFVIIDTAGIRHSLDEAESRGVLLAEKSIAEADMVMCVIDASARITPEDLEIIEKSKDKPRVFVANKSDLLSGDPNEAAWISVSALTGFGLETLKEACLNTALSGAAGGSEDGLVSNARHAESLRQASRLLAKATEALSSGLSEEFAAGEIRGALDALGEISGRAVSEDVLDSIFASFCIGK